MATASARGNAVAGEAEACFSRFVDVLAERLVVRRLLLVLALAEKTSLLRARDETRAREPHLLAGLVFILGIGLARKTCAYTPEPSTFPMR